MRLLKRYFALSLLICAAAPVRRALDSTAPWSTSGRLEELRRCGNAESRFALGVPISLGESGLYELTLITGISDRLAQEILAAKPPIYAHSLSQPGPERYKSLSLVHGIGPAKASLLAHYLEISSPLRPECTPDKPSNRPAASRIP